MKRREVLALTLGLVLPYSQSFSAPVSQKSSNTSASQLSFMGTAYLHRWSQGTLHEFTPSGQENLESWRDMMTICLYPDAPDGERLSAIANAVVERYRQQGKLLETAARPWAPDHPAEYFVAAVLVAPNYLEAVFARFVLKNGMGMGLIHSHRIYDENAGPAMSKWLQAHAKAVENALMSWEAYPAPAALEALPPSQ